MIMIVMMIIVVVLAMAMVAVPVMVVAPAMVVAQAMVMVAVPVVDEHHRMLGLVEVDDIVDVLREEATEDILKMAGAGEQLVDQQSFGRAFQGRFAASQNATRQSQVGAVRVAHKQQPALVPNRDRSTLPAPARDQYLGDQHPIGEQDQRPRNRAGRLILSLPTAGRTSGK